MDKFIWLVLIGERYEGAREIIPCSSRGVAEMVATDHRSADSYYEWEEVSEDRWESGPSYVKIEKKELLTTYTPKN